jgi:hypothetical protein
MTLRERRALTRDAIADRASVGRNFAPQNLFPRPVDDGVCEA